MLFTKASEYALLSLIFLSQKTQPIDVDTMSNELQISKSFLAKILQSLAKDKILNSFKGANGGFSLNINPSELTIKKIIECVEKRPTTVFECSNSIDDCPSNQATSCQIWTTLNSLQIKIDNMLDNITLQDITTK
ncbi:RrF2 family transcriptional regulator [Campylobacter pinnipediorum]|uniref:Transcriptional regulator, BadM/Rrf2 family n=2 Tax=Campylobacter pinnipediorum TaxID=1965231 RepID=A0A1S6U7X3_9BACT|nr:Rrf2 family transcriptional regulator [Campylobacter pinnipediorum]AQW81442.1 transcriptional regulator, BadM/Rrf2 family [Campylobacter pinnipediorum subsp. pinnipediorum]AQW83070.1 transcriptional regulator, BadM/Rrf2 family [Campylobacter pinnipediorum subsp. pinnipediorum]AQW84638.1 transcriptional regulator, BadM/Rrf2 family [Campylobacter pinnipediorum subsp. pinnipediorum]AQW86244.1 transcriptional regulator, BadM/Rrf2 family [Campylobacter pinnipediorum subsp. caledonicus]AQW87851.1